MVVEPPVDVVVVAVVVAEPLADAVVAVVPAA